MGVDVGYGAGIAPHPGPLPNGAREKTSAIFNIEHNRSPRPSGEDLLISTDFNRANPSPFNPL
ncbi:hypothetical protein DD753_13975 [Escherichia coli]|uniref:Uncharacterized protein n=1 Tax=Escherichia coli TaxID=562 RepID=A0A2J7L1C4_ECOLX|nr:hypothetical protein [Escherichia coli]MIA39149.1 hypothetical protein [Escherichia coli]PNB96637.1 hypothetical protein C1I39_13890 [Escherichia coli]PNC01509.1 hypothetical protein C1I42_13905 [Escherichia coli]PWH48700.1 hypothetical protein DD753_13975 [Escherichia coli]